MGLLEFRIFGQMLKGKTGMLVSDTIDYIDAEFDFRTDDWKGLSKWAHFSKGRETYSVNLIDDKITKDMHLNLSEGRWEVKLHGNDPDGTLRITTNSISFCVNYFGKMPNSAPLPEIPLSAAEQIDAKSQLALDTANAASGNASEAISKATEVYEAAQRGDFDGKDGEKGEKGEPGAAGNPGLLWKGEWDPEKTYTALKNGQASRDVVFYNGSAYVANHPAPITGLNPEENISGKWALLVKHGDTGATGPEGPAGKSAYSYAVDGGYTGTEEDFAKKMAEQPGSSSSENSENLPEVGESDNGKVLGVVGGNWEAMNLPDNSKADAVAVDFSRYESDGIIVETYADGSTLTHNFEFDSEGKPTKRTDSAGGVQTFTW